VVRYVNEPTPGSLADQQDEADPEQVARTIVLRRLSATPRTRRELHDDLRRRGIPDDVSERVLDRFVEVGLIDDAQFARQWAECRQRTKGSARSVLRQ
jgi:regulatory protein